jgi:HEPN domain-containing protein
VTAGLVIAMQFRAEQYYQVSLERMRQSRTMYETGAAYALAMYCGGLAVESLLRAFRWTEDTSFERRHDLSDLLKASRLLTIDEAFMRRKGSSEDTIRESGVRLRAAMNEVIILWQNNLRFASEASLKTFLNQIGRLRGVRGDALKKNAKDLLDAAQTVINRGVTLWISKTGS